MTEPSAIYFISDLHLEASYEKLVNAFEVFLLKASKDAKAIYILGDFFNTWIGDDNNSDFAKQIKSLLRHQTEKGIAIYFIHGNRDFLIGNRFANETGIQLLPEGHVIDLFGTPTILLHGDSLCTDDENYQAFRKKVRDVEWQNKMLAYPLFIRRFIAFYLRWRSKKENQNKADNIMDVNTKAVEQALRESQTRLMIHGHTHRPNRHWVSVDGQECERIVLGDWGNYLWYLRAEQDDLQLIRSAIR